MDKECKCGRIYLLTDHQFSQRDPGRIICKCGQIIHHWNGSTTWSAELVKGLPEDDGGARPFRYE